MKNRLTFTRTTRAPLWRGAALLLALAMGCSEEKLTENDVVDGPSFAPGTSLNVNLDQCANLATPCAWQNGNLNGNNSAYAEGDVVPFRLAVEGLTAGTHSIHINHDFTAGGNKAYDFLASVDASETVDLCAVGGGAVSSLCASGLPAPNAAGFPADAFNDAGDGSGAVDQAIGASGLGAGQRDLRIYGGTIVSISNPVHAGTVNGNSTVDMTVTFNSTGSAVLLVWGGHLAKSSFWKNSDDTPDGAGEVSGAPWHMRTQQLDGSGNKNQDRSIQPSAIVETHPSLSLTKTPSVTDVCTGTSTSVTYTYVVENTGDVTLSGSVIDDNGTPANTGDDANVGSFNLAPGATATLTRTVSITGGVTNIATASATFGAATVTATATATVNGRTCSISLTKTPDKAQVCNGTSTTVTYTYIVTNTGDFFNATGTVVDDAGTPAIPGDDITRNFTDLAPGASTPATGAGSLTSTASISATTTNTAVASGTSGGASVTATDDATVTAVTCGISVTKTPDRTQVCNGANELVTYTYVVTNNSGTGFDATNGSVVDDNGTPANTGDDVTVGTFTTLAPGASTPSSGAGTITAQFTVNGTRTNVATASATVGGATVTATNSATVNGVNCGVGQLAPTQTTCTQFANGDSPDLEPLQAGIRTNGRIGQINPGVFFFYASVTATSTTLNITVTQTVDPNPHGLPEFVAAGQVGNKQGFIYSFDGSSCSSPLAQLTGTTDLSGSLSGATVGATYIIGVKYGTEAPVGRNVGHGLANTSLAFYNFTINGFLGASDGADLFRKNTTP